MGIVFTGFTLRLFYSLITQVGPAKTAIAFYLSPAIAVIFGVVLLRETPTWPTLPGLIAIVAGSILAAKGPALPATELADLGDE